MKIVEKLWHYRQFAVPAGGSELPKSAHSLFPACMSESVVRQKSCFLYMPQKNYAFRMTLKENIMLGGRDEKKAESLMKSMRLEHLADKRANQLYLLLIL